MSVWDPNVVREAMSIAAGERGMTTDEFAHEFLMRMLRDETVDEEIKKDIREKFCKEK